MSTIKELNRRTNLKPHEKVEIKRRLDDGSGDYETDWVDVTEYVKAFGTMTRNLDTETIGVFVHATMTIIGDNTFSAWSDASDSNSLFSGFQTRYKTLFKVTIGLVDDDGTIQPSSGGSIFYGILIDDIVLQENEATMIINATTQIFQEQSASALTLVATDTAYDIVTKIMAIQDDNGNNVFDKFITGSYAGTTSVVYPDVTGGSNLEDQTCWDIINRLCLAEDFCAYIDGNGSFIFKGKSSGTDVAWQFFGAGVYNEEYGVNIAEIKQSNYIWSKIKTKVTIEHTEGSFATADVGTWQKGDNTTTDKYGEQLLSFQEFWLGTNAITLAQALYNTYNSPKREVIITSSTFNPDLDLLDRVNVTYYGEPSTTDAGIWGYSVFGSSYFTGVGLWTGNKGGIYLDGLAMNIIGITHDLDNFVSEFVLREV